MGKCDKCGQKDGVHKMSCESRKQFIVFPKLVDKKIIVSLKIFIIGFF